jgi:hypothetical protein
VLALLVAGGRIERRWQVHDQVRGMESVVRLVGPLDNPTLSGYRFEPGFACLTYRRGTNVLALELCIDRSGRLVEAIDRRTATRHIWSLRFAPSSSTARLDRREVARLFRKMTAS